MWWKPDMRLSLKEQVGTDRHIAISEPRVITYPGSRDPDEKVVRIELELTAIEILEIRAAMANHMQGMTNKNYHYSDLRAFQRILEKTLERFK